MMMFAMNNLASTQLEGILAERLQMFQEILCGLE